MYSGDAANPQTVEVEAGEDSTTFAVHMRTPAVLKLTMPRVHEKGGEEEEEDTKKKKKKTPSSSSSSSSSSKLEATSSFTFPCHVVTARRDAAGASVGLRNRLL